MARLRIELDLPEVYNEGDFTVITGATTNEAINCVKERFNTGMENHIFATDGNGAYKKVSVVQVTGKKLSDVDCYAEVKLK